MKFAILKYKKGHVNCRFVSNFLFPASNFDVSRVKFTTNWVKINNQWSICEFLIYWLMANMSKLGHVHPKLAIASENCVGVLI